VGSKPGQQGLPLLEDLFAAEPGGVFLEADFFGDFLAGEFFAVVMAG
jgi:hypothetical protein